jgi:cobalamin biosynthesis Co2+ chelatase CbiK
LTKGSAVDFGDHGLQSFWWRGRGCHLLMSLAVDEPDCWKSILTGKGFTCEPILKATADVPELADVWLEHRKSAFSHF